MGRSYLGLTGRTLQLERRNSTRRISRPPRWTSTPSERSERQNQRTTIINPLRRERNLPRKERRPRKVRKERNLPRRARKERNLPRRARKERNPPRRERKEKNLPRRERREGRERNPP